MPKGFKEAAAQAKPVYHTIIGCAQDTQHTHDAHDAQHTHDTKGMKRPRINMAFSRENLEYLRVMAALEGLSATQYVNALIEKDMAERSNTYRAAKELRGPRER